MSQPNDKLTPEQGEYFERKRDAFQSLLSQLEARTKAGQVTLLEQSSEWARSLGNINIALGAAIAPILFATSEKSQAWSDMPFYAGVLVLILNGVWIYYTQKMELEDGFNKLLWIGKEEQLNLLKMVNMLNRAIFYKTAEEVTRFVQFEKQVQGEEAKAMAEAPTLPKISIKDDLGLLFLVVGVYLIAAKIWPLSSWLYTLVGLSMLAILLAYIEVGVILARRHTKKADKFGSALQKERTEYMKWWKSRYEPDGEANKNEGENDAA